MVSSGDIKTADRSALHGQAVLIEPIAWSDRYCINNSAIDEQHQILVSLINDCIALVRTARQPRDEINGLLDRMLEYAYFHFESEEQWMRDLRYPSLHDHQQEHLQFFIYIKEAMGRFGKGALSAEDLLLFLKDWFIHHILGMDQLIKPR